MLGNTLFTLLAGQAVELAGVHLRALCCVGGVKLAAIPFRRRNHDSNGQVVGFGEHEVALVVRRYAHDDAGAVAEQNVVADQYGHALAGERVDAVCACCNAGLGLVDGQALNLALLTGALGVGLDL